MRRERLHDPVKAVLVSLIVLGALTLLLATFAWGF